MNITTKGLDLLSIMGGVEFTRAVIGNGGTPDDPLTLTELVSYRMDVQINHREFVDNETLCVSISSTNNDVPSGFSIHEIGLYAKDPESGQDILFFYEYVPNSSFMPSRAESPVAVEWVYKLYLKISNTDDVTITIPTEGYILREGFGANTIFKADTAGNPELLEVEEGQIVGRSSGGVISGLSADQVRFLENKSVNDIHVSNNQGLIGKTSGGQEIELIKSNAEDGVEIADGDITVFDSGVRDYKQGSITGSAQLKHYRNIFSSYHSGGSIRGTFKIKMPKSWSNTTMVIKLMGYYSSDNTGWEITIRAISQAIENVNEWQRCSVDVTGGKIPFEDVRLSHDGETCCILIGTTDSSWGYPEINVIDFIAMGSNLENWQTGWSSEIIIDESVLDSSKTVDLAIPMRREDNSFVFAEDVEIKNLTDGLVVSDLDGKLGNITPNQAIEIIDAADNIKYSKLDHAHDSDYSDISHNHDSEYYTRGQVSSLLSLRSLNDHNHDLDYPDLSHSHSDYVSIPSGTVMLFGQASAPVGWTKKLDWSDNAMLTVNSGSNGSALASGGSANPQAAHYHYTPSKSLSVAQLASHGHPYITTNAGGDASYSGGLTSDIGTMSIVGPWTGAPTTASGQQIGGSGSNSTHTHGNTYNNTAPLYQEIIAATKN